MKNISEKYDVIIIDGSDPVGPAEGLFEEGFYKDCFNGLNEDGVLTSQTESPWVPSYHSSIERVFKGLENIFEYSSMYLVYIPLYPSGMWSMAYASKQSSSLSEEVMKRSIDFTRGNSLSLKYYNQDVHRAAFALPNFVADIIK